MRDALPVLSETWNARIVGAESHEYKGKFVIDKRRFNH